MKTRIRKGHGADCRFDGPGKKAISGLFGINGVWSSFLSSEIITFAVILILARSGRKKECIFRRKDIK